MPTKKTLFLTCILTLSAVFAFAQEVELYSNDGTLSVRGELVDYANQRYTIDTSIGTMTFDTDTVLCRGDACPGFGPTISESGTTISEFSVVGVGTQASTILQELLPAYAESITANMNISADGAYVLTNSTDEEIARISLLDMSSSSNLSALLRQEAAIALTAQPLPSEQASNSGSEQRTDPGSGNSNSQVMGLNALTIVTAKDNPVTSISISDVAKVFSGEIANWSELGGSDAQIALYGPQENSELTSLFKTLIFNTRSNENAQLSEDIVEVEGVEEQVSSDPNGIGYTHFSISQTARALDVQGICGLPTSANSFSIKAEEYPLTQRFYIHQSARTNIEHLDTLLSFMQSDAGQDIVTQHGLLNQRDTSGLINTQGARFVNAIASSTTSTESELLREMVTQIMNSQRLSTTFRFETGTDQMDQRARADIIRLTTKLQSPEYSNSVVHLLGFTDSIGNFELNREVSLRRATQIRDALIENDADLAERVSIVSAGFGEIAPLACNENAQGRSINRRVEVWISRSKIAPTQ